MVMLQPNGGRTLFSTSMSTSTALLEHSEAQTVGGRPAAIHSEVQLCEICVTLGPYNGLWLSLTLSARLAEKSTAAAAAREPTAREMRLVHFILKSSYTKRDIYLETFESDGKNE